MRSKLGEYKVVKITDTKRLMVREDNAQSEAQTNTSGPVASLMVAKKRGRKPREKVYSVTNSDSVAKPEEQENIILHLPISEADITEDRVTDQCSDPMKYDPTPPMNEPSPYSPNLPGSFISGEKQESASVNSLDASSRQDEALHQSGRCEQFVDPKSGKNSHQFSTKCGCKRSLQMHRHMLLVGHRAFLDDTVCDSSEPG